MQWFVFIETSLDNLSSAEEKSFFCINKVPRKKLVFKWLGSNFNIFLYNISALAKLPFWWSLKAISKKALEKNTGARGLRAIIEEILLDIMFKLPDIKFLEKILK